MKNILKPLAKSGLIPLGFTAAASLANVEMHKKILGSAAATLIISRGYFRSIWTAVYRFWVHLIWAFKLD